MAETDTTSTGTENPEATQAADKAKAGAESKLFTQADLEKKIADRLARERASAAKAAEDAKAEAIRLFREEHGFDDEALEQWKQRDQAAAQTRAMKAAATKAENERKKLEAEHQRAISQLDQTLCENALVKALNEQKCTDIELALGMLRSKVKLHTVDGQYQAVVVDAKGEPTSDTIEDAVKQLLERKPVLRPAPGNFQGSGSRTTEGRTGSDGTDGTWRTPESRKQSLAAFAASQPRVVGSLTARPSK